MGSSLGGVLGAVGGIAGGLLGAGAAAGDTSTSKAAADASYNALINMGAPPDLAKQLMLQQYQQAGTLTPEMESYIQAGPAQTVSQDTGVRNQQMQALQLLQQRANSGLNGQDRANLDQIRTQMGADQQAKQAQIMQNAQARGEAGGGAELAAALSAAQGGANQASQEGDRIAAQASQNALAAASQSGQLAGQLRGQDTSINTQNANIQNEMNRFNTQNQIATQNQNVQAQNAANLYNTQTQQQLANANTSQQNTEQQREVAAQQQQWLDQLKLAQAQSGAYADKAAGYAGRAQATTNQDSLIGGALGQLGGYAASEFSSDPDLSDAGGGTGNSYDMGTYTSAGGGDNITGGSSSSTQNSSVPFSNMAYDGGMVTNHGTIMHGNNRDYKMPMYYQGGMVSDQKTSEIAPVSRPDTGWGAIIVPKNQQNSPMQAFANGGMVQDQRTNNDDRMEDMVSRPDTGWGSIIVKPTGTNGGGGKPKGMYNQGGMVQQPLQTKPDYDPQLILNMLKGGKVPGKAKVAGDSPKNDTVKAKLSPGEVVIPRSVIEHSDAPKHAADYVAWIKKIRQENGDR